MSTKNMSWMRENEQELAWTDDEAWAEEYALQTAGWSALDPDAFESMDPATAQADEEDLRADAEAEAQAEMAAVFTSKPDVDEEPFDLKHEPSTTPPVPRLVFEADPDDVAPAPTAPVAVDAKPAKEPLAELFIRVAHPKPYARDSLKRAEAVSLLSKCRDDDELRAAVQWFFTTDHDERTDRLAVILEDNILVTTDYPHLVFEHREHEVRSLYRKRVAAMEPELVAG